MTELWRNSIPFNFAVRYKIAHPQWSGPFEINDGIYSEFVKYLSDSGFDYRAEGETELKKFIDIQKKRGQSESIIAKSEELLIQLMATKEQNIQKYKSEISRLLINELAEKYYGSSEKIRYTINYDKQLREAISVLNNKPEYKKILAIN